MPADVIIEGDWYVPVTDSKLGLHRVEYSPNFESESCGFLKDCVPNSVCLWPANPFEEDQQWRHANSDEPPHGNGGGGGPVHGSATASSGERVANGGGGGGDDDEHPPTRLAALR